MYIHVLINQKKKSWTKSKEKKVKNINTESYNKKQSIIIPYHKNKDMLYYILSLLLKTVPDNIEIIIIANNYDKSQIDIEYESKQVKIYKIPRSMLYSEAMNLGVSYAEGEIITMFDQDVFCMSNWYEPLLQKLLSSDKIGAVASKLINPTNNRIIDFGIAYSPQSILHPMRGLPCDHPYSRKDRKVLSACGAVMMTYKSLYEKVGGMDITMPYICCDCDYGIKIKRSGYETWVVANSCLYHKGSSSSKNTKISEYSYLRSDSKAMFYAKEYPYLEFNMSDFIQDSGKKFKEEVALLKYYYLYDMTSLPDAEFFINCFKDSLNIKFYDIFKFNIGQRYPVHLQLYDHIPLSYLGLNEPIIYFVDSYVSLFNNALWWEMRKCKEDIIIDTNGNFFHMSEIKNMKY